MVAAIALDGITKVYGQATALESVDLHVAEGALCGLVGPNGAGKTTLSKIMTGVTTPTQGTVRVLGHNPQTAPASTRLRIGVMHQAHIFDMMLTPLDNLKIAAVFRRLSWRGIQSRVEELLTITGLEGRTLSQPTFTLSGGQLQRLGFVRTMLSSPDIIILDEPSAGLDAAGTEALWRYLHAQRLQRGLTLLWTSHVIGEIELNCHEVIVLKKGRTIFHGAISDFTSQHSSPRARVRLAEVPSDAQAGALTDVLPDANVLGPHVTVSLNEHDESDIRKLIESTGLAVVSVQRLTPDLESAYRHAVA